MWRERRFLAAARSSPARHGRLRWPRRRGAGFTRFTRLAIGSAVYETPSCPARDGRVRRAFSPFLGAGTRGPHAADFAAWGGGTRGPHAADFAAWGGGTRGPHAADFAAWGGGTRGPRCRADPEGARHSRPRDRARHARRHQPREFHASEELHATARHPGQSPEDEGRWP